MVKDPQKLVNEIARQVGKPLARRLLVDQGVSTSTAEKLVRDSYNGNNMGQLLVQAIERAHEASKKIAS